MKDIRMMGVKRIYDKSLGSPTQTGHYIRWEKIWKGICYRCGKVWADHYEPNGNSYEADCYDNESGLKFL